MGDTPVVGVRIWGELDNERDLEAVLIEESRRGVAG
jgi:hypothetical protein